MKKQLGSEQQKRRENIKEAIIGGGVYFLIVAGAYGLAFLGIHLYCKHGAEKEIKSGMYQFNRALEQNQDSINNATTPEELERLYQSRNKIQQNIASYQESVRKRWY